MLSRLTHTPIYRNSFVGEYWTALPPHWWSNKKPNFDLNLLASSRGQCPTRWNKHQPSGSPDSPAVFFCVSPRYGCDWYILSYSLDCRENCTVSDISQKFRFTSPPRPPQPPFSSAYQWCNVPTHSSEKKRGWGKRGSEREKISSYTNISWTTTLSKKWGALLSAVFDLHVRVLLKVVISLSKRAACKREKKIIGRAHACVC